MKQFEWCDEKYVILDRENFNDVPEDEVLSLFYKSNDIAFQYRYIGCIINPIVKFSPSGRIVKVNGLSIGSNVFLAYEVEEVEE